MSGDTGGIRKLDVWAAIAAIVAAVWPILEWFLDNRMKEAGSVGANEPIWMFLPRWGLLIAALVIVSLLLHRHWQEKKANTPLVAKNAGELPLTQSFEEIRGKTFTGEKVELDGKRFINCVFRGCVLHYVANATVRLEYCRFEADCKWFFGGHAELAVGFLSAMYQANPPLVERTFDRIRGKEKS